MDKEKQLLDLMQALIDKCPLADDIDQTINNLLAFIGDHFSCDRCRIFQKNYEGLYYNSFEWCANDVLERKDQLQKETIDTFNWCVEQNESVVMIEDIEVLKQDHPVAYATIKSIGIKAVIGMPIIYNNELIAVLGIDDPDMEHAQLCKEFLQLNSNYINVVLRNSILQNKLFATGYRDQLTGAYSRHAFFEDAKDI
ncbi:MAG: GAF domain-containing protein, partial [Erysipelotrichaceae bacterium]|nr:GAF domain-containing protein [Erysipelotrichaceae bacterium]